LFVGGRTLSASRLFPSSDRPTALTATGRWTILLLAIAAYVCGVRHSTAGALLRSTVRSVSSNATSTDQDGGSRVLAAVDQLRAQ